MNGFKGKKSYISLVLVCGILLYIALICGVNLFHFNYEMNSDIASDVILGELIWKSGEIIPDTWYIANETRIVCTPNLAALFFGITHNMTLASGLACCVMSIMILFSVAYFAKSADMKISNVLLMSFLCMAIPCSLPILELLYLFASYYAIHVIFLFVTLAFYVKILKSKEFKWIKLIIGIAMALLLGLQGVRGILVIYGPMFGIELLRNVYLFYRKQKRESSDFYLTAWTVSLLIASFIGTCFPFSIGQGLSRNVRKGCQKFLTVVMPDMMRALGWEAANKVGKLCLGVLLLISLYVLITLFGRMIKREFITPIEWSWLVLFSSPAVSAFIVAFTTVESTQRYYFMLPFLLVFSVVLLLERKVNKWKSIGLAVSIILTVINTVNIYLPILSTEEPPDSSQYEVIKFLEKENYSIAYATFEHANMMTVLANGEVRVYPVATVENMDICKWMTSTDWYCPNLPYEQETAYIITDVEMDTFQKFLDQKEEFIHIVKKIGKYSIYISDKNYSNLG